MTTKGGGRVGRNVSICRSLMECCVFVSQCASYLEQSDGVGEERGGGGERWLGENLIEFRGCRID